MSSPLPDPLQVLSIADWREIALDDPERFLGTLRLRLKERMDLKQSRAVIAALADDDKIMAEIAAATSKGSPLIAPYFLKDLFDLAGLPTRAGSVFLAETRPIPTRDSAIVEVLRAAGAICAGKTQLHEFAYGLTGQNPHYGDCSHPRFPDRTTGGSSGGSAAVVAAGIVPFALGTDTGGSIRLPAAFCGLFGYRHIPGDAWIQDAFPLAPSCDTAGWLTGTAADMQAILGCLCGNKRPADREPHGCYLECGDLDEDVRLACRKSAEFFCQAADDHTRDQLLHAFRPGASCYTILTSAEAAQVHAPFLERFRERYSAPVWQRLDRGRHWSVDQLCEAEIQRRFLRDTLLSYFLTYDFLLLPAAPCAALRHSECDTYDRNRILQLSAPASLAGLPVLTIPVPLANGLSAGLQVLVPSPRSPVLPWVLRQIRS
jgi:amidase/aspartyl-tRNA(Asn)/glutamyl-tRNA(Gln) amidotransferase subunit A